MAEKEDKAQINTLSLGIDIGSTTVKTVVLSPDSETLFSRYERHRSKVRETVLGQLSGVGSSFPDSVFKVSVTGSAGLGLAERAGLPFVQEVQGAYLAVRHYYPQTDVTIELGGEDAKIIFLTGGLEERMNGSCAGGTGAFIDQMAALLNVTTSELDEMSLQYQRIYPIASRCGVFAKSDIQPLLNQGARREDMAMSIYRAVVDQTLSGLAQGRLIKGNVLFLGGPLSFLKGLRKAFVDRLSLTSETAFFPKDAAVFMAIGAALFASRGQKTLRLEDIVGMISRAPLADSIVYGTPLFANESEYLSFVREHDETKAAYEPLASYQGDAYLGIDAGSTTTKLVLLSRDSKILFSGYTTNKGQPIDTIVRQLKEIYAQAPAGLKIVASAVTGYGERLIQSCLKVDYGLVETVAHYKAASFFEPDVDFIIDIGGQDIKCFRIRNKAIDSIMLNEACSSGCGSFIQTFANAIGMGVADFAKLGLFAKHPVELGSRCTVFMNSSVKQAQKEGASLEDISAGLSSSIVKNAIYKVIRFHSADDLGNKIVCQGGTFLNDAILRAFEREIGKKVIRPSIAGLMGAFGAALYAKEKGGDCRLITSRELNGFSYKSMSAICQGCTAHCNLTIIRFNDRRTFISGNKCAKGEGKPEAPDDLNIYAYKLPRLTRTGPTPAKPRGKVGLPLALAMYEQLPLWDVFFRTLGFDTVISGVSDRNLYFLGQHTIASDTVCYPAKLMHGHIERLLDLNPDFIFYPSASYNLDEHDSVNHFNCPVVAYYGELLKKNNPRLSDSDFLDPFIDLNSPRVAARTLAKALSCYHLGFRETFRALKAGLMALDSYHRDVEGKADEIIARARAEHKHIIVLAGRPYHLDPEVNHGIDRLISSLGMAVISEDSIFRKARRITPPEVLNQWTYHARLYRAADYVADQPDMQLVQLVSFGCGVDAITTDEVRRILEAHGKFYTQLKIDEISNLGAIRIRLRSLKAAIEEQEKNSHNV